MMARSTSHLVEVWKLSGLWRACTAAIALACKSGGRGSWLRGGRRRARYVSWPAATATCGDWGWRLITAGTQIGHSYNGDLHLPSPWGSPR